MANVKVFWLDPTEITEVSLRRYYRHTYETKLDDGRGYNYAELVPGLSDHCPLMPGSHSYHNISVIIGREPYTDQASNEVNIDHTDPRWPTTCACGYVFVDADHWQVNYDQLHSGAPDGALYTLNTAPIGAMWDAHWLNDWWHGPDGISLLVKTPGGDWNVDGEASNCTDPAKNHPVVDELGKVTNHLRTHFCWVRHGDPRTSDVHVDKQGQTCSAGAGSILIGKYHGFLREGFLTEC